MLLGAAGTLLLLAAVTAQDVESLVSGETLPGREQQEDDQEASVALDVPSPLANTGAAGTGSLSTRVGYFDVDDSGDGNPFLDESLTVIEAVVLFDYNVSDRFGYSLKLSYDNISSASIDRLSKFPEQSGASGDDYIGLDWAFRYAYDPRTRYGGHLGYSTEYDYRSIRLGGSLELDRPERNARIGLSLDGYFDEVDVIRFDGTEEGGDTRTTVSATVNWYQVMSPKMHGEVGVTVAWQEGFLETPYNAVVLEDPMFPPNPNLDNNAQGIELTEELPDQRLRTALFGRARRLMRPGTALELGGRLYADDWGITSVTIEPRLYQSLGSDDLKLRARYRFYTQTEADAFMDHFTTAEKERTQDSDLGAFDSHTLGLKLIWDRPRYGWDIGVDFIDRSDGLDQLVGSIGWTWRF